MQRRKTNDLDFLRHVRSEPQREAHARAEHLRILARHSTYSVLGNLAGSLTLVVGLWSTIQKSLLITWLSFMILFGVIRWLTGRHFPTGIISDIEIQRWERWYIVTVVISGVLWGVAGGLFYLPNQPEQGLFLALLIAGMCAAAAVSLSFHRTAYLVFLLLAVSPISLQLMLDRPLVANAVGFVLPFYFILLFLRSRDIYQTAHESIVLRMNSQYQAMYDYLTGVANRRAFEAALEREWYRARRDKQMLSLVIADIDNFKHCNDTHGHVAGDTVLKAVAALLEQHIRRGADFVARIGGEEFAILLPETDLDGAFALAESIRDAVRGLTSRYQDEILEVTMSFGVSSLVPEPSLKPGLLFSRADTALYQAKHKGKDRVEVMEV